MKRFLTIFPLGANIHLVKDVGMIPFILQKEYGYDSTLATYRNGEYSYLSTEVKGLKHVFIKKIFGNHFLDVLIFILSNFKKYDILQVYHLTANSIIWTYVFKLLKFNRAKTYLKLDADGRTSSPGGIKRIISKLMLRKLDLITGETREYAQLLNDKGLVKKKVEYCPNGFYDDGIRNDSDYNAKKNIILTVGRIGTVQKASETLVEGFRLFSQTNRNWKLEVVGPIEPAFNVFITDYFVKYPELKDQITFLGGIYDRNELEAKYRSAKIFALTSRWEGFPLVFPEAIKTGCFIVSTEIPASKDVVENGKYGILFPIDDTKALAEAFGEATSDDERLRKACSQIQHNAYKDFYWPEICKRIAHYLF